MSNDKENIMNEALPRQMYQVPTDATIPVGHYYYLTPAAGGAVYLGYTGRPYPPSERDPKATYFSLQRLQAKPLPIEVGSLIFDIVTMDGDEYEFGMRLRDSLCWGWVLLDPATGRADYCGSRHIDSFNLEPATPDPLDESNKAPRVDSDGDVLIWVEDKGRWDYTYNAGDEDSRGYLSLEVVIEEYGVSIDGFASEEQVSRAQP